MYKRRKMMKWISVTERMPEVDTDYVLVFLASGSFQIDRWHQHHEDPTNMGSKTMYMGDMWENYDYEDITHWSPITAPPMPDENE